jgi:hypothetical protein
MNWVCADPEDWQLEVTSSDRLSLLQNWIGEHRLGGWLYWRFQQADRLDLLPPELKDNLRSSFRQTSYKALLQRSELKQTIDLLAKASIPAIALKGSYLQRYIFPHSGLRPMRDLDILVPRPLFQQAWQVLHEGGYRSSKGLAAHPDNLLPVQNQIALISLHHIKVELHRAVGFEWPVELSTLPSFWEKNSNLWIDREGICYLCPELLYIHLCVHHSWQHHWNIGPLGWVDLHLMSQSHQIDRVRMQQLGFQLQLETQINTALRIYQQIGETAATGIGDLSLLFLPPVRDLGNVRQLDRVETYSLPQAIARKLTLIAPKTNPHMGWRSRWGQLLRHLGQWIASSDRLRDFAIRLSYRWKRQLWDNDAEIRSFRHQLQNWYD